MTATFPFAKSGVFYLANGMGLYMWWAGGQGRPRRTASIWTV